MGIQQLLLIVVGVIVVALAVYAGITIVNTYSGTSDRDQLISKIYDLGLEAQRYYEKMEEQNKGEGTFLGWSVPQQIENNKTGTFYSNIGSDHVNLCAEGTHIGRNETTVVRVIAKVDKHKINITVIN